MTKQKGTAIGVAAPFIIFFKEKQIVMYYIIHK